MAETGVLDPQRRYELLEGEIIDVPPQNEPHSRPIERLNRLLVLASKDRYALRPQLPLAVDEHNLPEPDLALVRIDYTGRPAVSDTYVVIEVADSSITFDRRDKQRVYARSGVPEYWIVNVPKRCIEIYRRPGDGSYLDTLIVTSGETAAVAAFPDVSVRVDEIFG
jgi:Uma2 family endonuclease